MDIVKNSMFSKIYEVDCFQKEFKKMTKEKLAIKPPYPRYQKWLIASLTILEEYGKDAINLENFEQLESVKPSIYSIRYPKSKLNPRVLYVYLENGDILLLTAFKEERKSDYTRNIKMVKKRLKALDA
ncbi:MAG TPA: hypothetical protein GXZ21_09130 [Clostridiales bacterium]|nr:hypothetical protein [Clostridiales bacterium]